MPGDNPTRMRLLAAALELICEDGIQAVSHRAAEERAGVARGSTRYHFKTRDSLLAAVLGYLAELDYHLIERIVANVGQGKPLHELDPVRQSAVLQQMTEALLAESDRSLARFELYLYAARRPELAEALTAWRDGFVAFGAPLLQAAGAPHAEAGQRLLVSAMQGLLLDALTVPHPDFARWSGEWVARLGVQATRLGTTQV